MAFDNFTPEELMRLTWLRAVEWVGWPAFLSQPLLPVLYVFYPVPWVLGAVIASGILWLPFRHRPVLRLARLGPFWVRLKWLTGPIGLFFLLQQRRYVAGVIILLTPWLASFLNYPAMLLAAIASSPSQVGVVQKKLLAQIEADNPPAFTSAG